VQGLGVDPAKRRISLGLKQTQENPWAAFAANHPPGTTIEGQIRNITEFGLFIGLDGGIDGMVHLSDLDWTKPGEEALKDFKKGDSAKAVVLEADSEKERISLGIKQLTTDPFASGAPSTKLKKGLRVTCEVLQVKDNGIEAKLLDHDVTTFIRRSDLSRDRSEQRPDRFGVGEKFDAVVTQVDAKARKVSVSIKALEIAEEKEAVAQYGSTDSGASLGDLLGAALNKAKGDEGEEEGDEDGQPFQPGTGPQPEMRANGYGNPNGYNGHGGGQRPEGEGGEGQQQGGQRFDRNNRRERFKNRRDRQRDRQREGGMSDEGGNGENFVPRPHPQVPEGFPIDSLGDLKRMPAHKLLEMAETLQLHEGVARMRKQDVPFQLLKVLTRHPNGVAADGVLEILPHRSGFRASPDARSRPGPDDL